MKSAKGFFDGAAAPTNPGRAGCGWFVDAERCGHRFVGERHTNNEAEYHGFLALAEHFQSCPETYDHVTLCGDSMLVVNQVEGKWKCKSANLAELQGEAKAALRDLRRKHGTVTVRHVPREQNKEADKLAGMSLRVLS